MPEAPAAVQTSRDCYTLKHVARLSLELYFECARCRKISRFDPIILMRRYGENAIVGYVKNRLRCGRCGCRKTVVLMRESGSRNDWGWWPRRPGATR